LLQKAVSEGRNDVSNNPLLDSFRHAETSLEQIQADLGADADLPLTRGHDDERAGVRHGLNVRA